MTIRPPEIHESPRRRKRIPGWVVFSLLGVCLVGNFVVLGMALYPKWPSLLPSLPGYDATPDPCKSVSPELISTSFQPNLPRDPDKRDESTSLEHRTTCEWRPYKDQADALGQYSYLTVEVTAYTTSGGRPDFESVVDDFDFLQKSNAVDVPGLGDRAAAVHEWDEVTLLASRANLAVKVTYNSVNMVPPHREAPVPPTQLDIQTRHIAQQVLTAAGDPE